MATPAEIEAKRDAAARARRIARWLSNRQDVARLLAFAEELEAEAAAVEARLSAAHSAPARTEIQMQQQAQADTEKEDKDS